jgi:hypothetical protein
MNVIIPLSQYPNQIFDVALNGQYCTITLLQRTTGLFFGLSTNGIQIADSVQCQNNQPVIFPDYRGFNGTILFIDKQATDDPTWDGLGTRYELRYAS